MQKGMFSSSLLDTFRTICIALIVSVFIKGYVWQPSIVHGASMAPTLQSNEYLGVNKLAYTLSHPKRGDIVVFHYPKDPRERYVKRIIGLPGERIEIKDNKIYIYNQEKPQGFKLDEHVYLPDEVDTIPIGGSLQELYRIPEGHYFVLGDNRVGSSDSREWGMVPRDYLVGKAVLRFQPMRELQRIPQVLY